MPLNIDTVENAYLAGHARFEAWRTEFEAKWYQPIGKTVMQELFNSMTPEQKEMLRSMDPEAYDRVVEMIQGG